MADSAQGGTWLLVDAAGPAMVAGLVRHSQWLAVRNEPGGFLESLPGNIRAVLAESGLALADLAGAWYACGPGSTLGLRLAAMLLRGLQAMPHLRHWRTFQYNNLALACAGLLDPARPAAIAIAAPWRRDRMHRAVFAPGPPPRFTTDAAPPEAVMNSRIQSVDLGARPAALPDGISRIAYPAGRIPQILNAFPTLLEPVDQPAPYTAADPDFARWSRQRHAAR
jgi:tRNA A37 threonylcarbamoyladenosine modification protein TsaB